MSKKVIKDVRRCLFCGDYFEVYVSPSRVGRGKYCSQSCSTSVTSKKHGHTTHNTASKTYTTWAAMISRCERKSSPKYYMYGAVGVKVCDRWHDFMNFLSDMGERPEGKTIDRWPNGAGNYEPNNCRWATIHEQQRNLKNNRNITFNGKTQCMSQWAREYGMDTSVLRYRINRGYDLKAALTLPVKYGNRVIKSESKTTHAPPPVA